MSHNSQFDQYSVDVILAGNIIHTDVMGPAEGHGMDNPNGATLLALTGYGESANTWEPMARRLVTESGAQGLELNVVRYTDPYSYTQQEHNDVADTLAREVRNVVHRGHRVYLLGHSRGGVTGALIGEAAVKDGIVDGVFTMAAPVKGVPLSPLDMAMDAAATPRHAMSTDALRMYGAFTENLLRHAGLDKEAFKWGQCPLDLLKSMGRKVLGALNEAQEVGGSDITEEMVALDGMTSVIAIFGGRDGLVPGRANIRHLREAGYAGDAILLADQTHCSVMTNGSAAVHVVRKMQGQQALLVA